MLITTDFVTNSSSSSYIISCDENDVGSIINYINNLKQRRNETHIHFIGRSMKELKDFTNGKVYDWASKAQGFKFVELEKDQYSCSAKEIVKKQKTIMFISVDYFDDKEFFDELSEHIIGNWE